jgi:CRISPR-associated endonuclease/helicase Cas3
MQHANLSHQALTTARWLAGFCGLFHDVGKLTRHFQGKLAKTIPERDTISHEWISTWILAHMLRQNALDWNGFLAAWDDWEHGPNGIDALARNAHSWRPFDTLDSFQSTALMVVATHHRLFSVDNRRGEGFKAITPPDASVLSPARNHVGVFPWTMEKTVWYRPEKWDHSKAETARWQVLMQQGRVLLDMAESQPEIANPVPYWHKVGLITRAALVLADHHVSGREFVREPQASSYKSIRAYANSLGKGKWNQPLTWHLEQVGGSAATYVDFFGPQPLPSLSKERREAIHGNGAPACARFAWQDRASEFIRQTRLAHAGASAFLIFNVASTGAGKTRANVRVLEACRTPDDPLRVTAGFNLKTLTLQTASAYRNELGLTQDDCACVIGDPLARALHLHQEQDEDDGPALDTFNSSGCDSDAFLNSLPDWVRALDKPDAGHANATLVAAPVLVATMDYLVAAGDPTQQAHHTQALLRIAHSDLLIDEADSYDPNGLVAVLRVVQMAGMFDRNVVVSTATLSPVLAEQIERAWQSGIAMHAAESTDALKTHTVLVSNLGSAIGSQLLHEPDSGLFGQWYRQGMGDLYRLATGLPTHRLCKIVNAPKRPAYLAKQIAKVCLTAHASHAWSAQVRDQSVQVSIGLVRFANVDPLQKKAAQLTQQKWPENTVVKICTYHARDIAMRRYLKEQALDQLLKRHNDPDMAQHPLIAKELVQLPEHTQHLILIVLASPVEEIGRDHDFDWAVIEPSSMHAIIQLVGRVNRHRLVPVFKPNVFVLEKNIKQLENEHKPGSSSPCFVRPGLQQVDGKGKPSTHLQPSAFSLLQPVESDWDVTQPFALDAGLVFDPQRRCHFAEEDDKAITHLLRDAGVFFDPQHAQWACDWFYVKHPLRDRQRNDAWRIEPIINDKLKLEKYERNRGYSPWVEKCADATEYRIDPECWQWLCPTIHEADQQLRTQLESLHGAGSPHVMAFLQIGRQFSLKNVAEHAPLIQWSGIGPQS